MHRSGVGRIGGGAQGGDLIGDVAGELHHFIQAPVGVEDRVVRGFQKQGFAVFVFPLKTMGVIFATVERGPKSLVSRGIHFTALAEQAVVLADDFFARILHRTQEVIVGIDDLALRGKFDHRHGAADGVDQALVLVFMVNPCGNVRGDFDHALHLIVAAQHRHVAGFEPHLLAVLIQAHKGAAQGFAPRQVAPQLGVGLGVGVGLFAKDAVMLAANLLDVVAHGFAEVLIGVEDHAVAVEFDHRHGTADGGELGVGFGERTGKTLDFLQVGFVMAVEHDQITLDSRRLKGAFHSCVGQCWLTFMGK